MAVTEFVNFTSDSSDALHQMNDNKTIEQKCFDKIKADEQLQFKVIKFPLRFTLESIPVA